MSDNECPECGDETIGGALCLVCKTELAGAQEEGPDLYDLVTDYPSDAPPKT